MSSASDSVVDRAVMKTKFVVEVVITTESKSPVTKKAIRQLVSTRLAMPALWEGVAGLERLSLSSAVRSIDKD